MLVKVDMPGLVRSFQINVIFEEWRKLQYIEHESQKTGMELSEG